MGEFNAMLRGSQDPVEPDDLPDDLTDPKGMAKMAAKVREYSAAAAAANDEAVSMFLKYVIEWDLGYPDGSKDNDGNLIPADAIVPFTMEGLQAVEKPMITKIIQAWHMAMMAVPVPLKQASTDGRRSEEATLDLGSLSESPPSWPKPN